MMRAFLKSVSLASVICGITLLFNSHPIVSASQVYSGLDKARSAQITVKAKRTMIVNKVRIGPYEGANRTVARYKLHKGSLVFASGWVMSSGGYTVRNNGRFLPTDKYFYVIDTPSPTKWYKKLTWHHGAPKFARGYWHGGGYTNLIKGTHDWTRLSGWNNYTPGLKFRYPWHGYNRLRYRREGKHYLMCGYAEQTGFYEYYTYKKSQNSNKMYSGNTNGTHWSVRYRGNK